MRRWVLPGDASTPDDLRLEEVERPSPAPGEVLVRVEAISINARDTLILTTPFGRIPGQDLVPLSDVTGTVVETGSGVQGWSVGERVVDIHNGLWLDEPMPRGGSIGPGSLDEPGVLAEYVVLPQERLARVPDALDPAAASAVPVAGVTAWHALMAKGPVTAADTVLVVGSGGVAVFALQLARAAGATVYAAVRRKEKGRRLVELGAEDFVLTSEDGWGAALFARTSGGITRVIDSVGTSLLSEYLAAVGLGGEIELLGLFDTGAVPVDNLSLIGKLASIRGIAVGSGRMQKDLLAFLVDHGIAPVIGDRIPFDRAPDAYRALAGPDVFGKVVIEVGRGA